VGDANHFATAQRFASPTVTQMTALWAFLPYSPRHFRVHSTDTINSANGCITLAKDKQMMTYDTFDKRIMFLQVYLYDTIDDMRIIII
jgi:hypothetical protein